LPCVVGPRRPAFHKPCGTGIGAFTPAMYAKVFTQILDSSLAENFHVRHMFEDLLKLCDPNGVVDMTFGAIARRLKMPEKSVRIWIKELEKPDPDSRTPDHEGRRLVLLDDHREWGWLIVNHAYYRQLASEDQRREKTRIRTEKWRKKKDGDAPVTLGDASDAIQKQKQKQSTEAEGERSHAEIPSWEEFWAYCQTQACLLPAEWYARDKWEAANASQWRDKVNWKAYARRCKGWWEADGRPMTPKGQNEKYGRTGQISGDGTIKPVRGSKAVGGF
jgi:hypothetical protein